MGSVPGEVLVDRSGVEVLGNFLRGARGDALRCQVPQEGEYCPRGERPHPWWGVHLDGPLRAHTPDLGRVEHSADHVRGQDWYHPRALYDDSLRLPAVAAPGVQGHFCLSRVGNSVDGFMDVHAAARGLILDPALRHTIAQGGACSGASHCGQRPVVGGRPGMLSGAPALAGAVHFFHAGQRASMLPIAGVGLAGAPLEGAVAITSKSESVSLSSWWGSPPQLWSPSALMISCAASSVGDQGHVLRGAVGSAIAVLLCLRAGMTYGSSVTFSCL